MQAFVIYTTDRVQYEPRIENVGIVVGDIETAKKVARDLALAEHERMKAVYAAHGNAYEDEFVEWSEDDKAYGLVKPEQYEGTEPTGTWYMIEELPLYTS